MRKKRPGFTKKAELEQSVKEFLKAKGEQEKRESFGKIYKICNQWVKGIIGAYVRDKKLRDIINSDDIDDIAAEVFGKLNPKGTNRGLSLIKDPSKVTSFIYSAVINTIKRRIYERTTKKGRDALDRVVSEIEEHYEYDLSYRISPQEYVEMKEKKQIVKNAWKDLSYKDWRSAHIIYQNFWNKKKISQIAKSFHTTSSKTFEKRKADYKRLREILKNNYGAKNIFDL